MLSRLEVSEDGDLVLSFFNVVLGSFEVVQVLLFVLGWSSCNARHQDGA